MQTQTKERNTMKNNFKQLICSALLLAMLAACSSIPTTIRSPAGAKITDSQGSAVGTVPSTVPVWCGPTFGQGLLMWMTIVLIPVEIIASNPSTEYNFTLDELALQNAGFSKAEIREIMGTGNTIQTTFKSSQFACAEAAKFEIESKSIRAVLLEGETATYSWDAAGGGWIRGTMKRKQ
jgi:hypothetical protein